MKTSGSKRQNVANGHYAEDRHSKNDLDFEELPQHESIKTTKHFYNGKINYGPLVRFLRGQVGNTWEEVYSEIVSRIPTKLLAYKKIIFWFVADKVEFIDGKPWNKRSQQFIWTGEACQPMHYSEIKTQPEFKEFYIDPSTNKLVRIEQKSFKRLVRKKE